MRHKEADTAVAEVTREEKAEQGRLDRLAKVFDRVPSRMRSDPRLLFSSLPADRQLAVIEPEVSVLSELTDLTDLQPERIANRLRQFALLVTGRDWHNAKLEVLASDALQGLVFSLEEQMPGQVTQQVGCLVRCLARDCFQRAGLDANEVRFQRKRDNWGDTPWNRRRRTLTSAELSLSDRSESSDCLYYIMTGPEEAPQRIRVMDPDTAMVRLSANAFRSLRMLRELPRGMIQDIWVAELLGEDRRVDGRPDPILIVQICGRSYALCSWEE